MSEQVSQLLDGLQEGQVWDLTGQGLVYLKGKDNTLSLIATFNSLESAKVHGVVKGEAVKKGWVVDDSSPMVVNTQEEQMEFTMGLKQQQLENMRCPARTANYHWRPTNSPMLTGASLATRKCRVKTAR